MDNQQGSLSKDKNLQRPERKFVEYKLMILEMEGFLEIRIRYGLFYIEICRSS
jgi:hypothetical protein